ncbi:uncharacterized protein ACMZJ9_014324 [Mantella aurantiaca]
MLVLTCSSKLVTLRRILTRSFPESLKVCGALQHVITGNPFKLEVLVDQWPNFSTVICRPPLEDMKDSLDYYMNTYFLFSKDPQNLHRMLEDSQAINWNQDLQIQGCQPALDSVLQEISSKYGRQMQTTSNFLYMMDKMKDEDLVKINNIRDLQFSVLLSDDASLVNATWSFGGNDRCERYIRRCIENFPTVCMRREGVGKPLAWVVSEQSAEMRMGYTDKHYRGLGVLRTMNRKLTEKMEAIGAPLYGNVAPDNKSSQAAVMAAGFLRVGTWQQWKFQTSGQYPVRKVTTQLCDFAAEQTALSPCYRKWKSNRSIGGTNRARSYWLHVSTWPSCLSIIMISLTCSTKLASLRKLLSHSFPKSLKVYGALHYVINKNPFKLQVLVDQWPDFTSVICCPLLEEMKDPLDHYTNTYFVFSKDPQSLSHMLQDPQTVNWSQRFQIQGCQTELGDVIHTVLSKHGVHMMTVSNVLYLREKKITADEVEAFCNTRTSDLQFSPLNPDEASLVNAQWLFGGNERSENYIRRCIQTFPTLCTRTPGMTQPIGWSVSEQSAEIRMGFTESPYRSQRLFGNVVTRLMATQQLRGAPVYCHVPPDNKKSQSACMAIGFIPVGSWLQWSYQPIK